jgi:hypothetical protein
MACGQGAANMADLGDDFPDIKMADETHLPSGAKHTTHRTARLRTKTSGKTTRVTHQNRFDHLAVGQAEEIFSRQPVAAVDFLLLGRAFDKKAFARSEVRNGPAFQRRQKFHQCRVSRVVVVNCTPQRFGMMFHDTIRRQDLV